MENPMENPNPNEQKNLIVQQHPTGEMIENEELQISSQMIDIDFINQVKEKAEQLEKMERSVSVVAKYFEFKQPLNEVMATAQKQKTKEEQETYLKMSLANCSTRGVYLGTTQEWVIKKDKETGEETNVLRSVVRWYNKEGMWVHFGVQLVSAFRNIPIMASVEIVFVNIEKTKGDGYVKIYDVFLLSLPNEQTNP